MTFEEFKKTCYYTRDLLKIPLANQSIEKINLIKKGKYNFEKEREVLMKVYDDYNFKDK